MKKFSVCIFIVVFLVCYALLTQCGAITWSDYTNTNLLPLPYTSGAPSSNVAYNGIAFSIQEDGTIQIAGTALFSTTFYFARNVVLENKTYNFSATLSPATLPAGVWIGFDILNNGYWQSSVQANTDFMGQTSKTYDFYVNLQAGNTYSFTLQPMLSAGAGQKAYQPYIPYFIEQAENYTKNPFEEATFQAMLESTEDITIKTFTPTFFTNGVSLKPLYDYCQDQGYTSIQYLEITWSDAYTWDYTVIPLYISSPARNIDGIVYNQNGQANGLQVSDNAQDARPLLLQPDTYIYYPTNVKTIRLEPIGTINDLQYTSLSINVEEYNKGFANGYTEGLRGNDSDIYSAGKADGYKNGFIEGKAEGLALSETGDWRSLISAVLEAPVNTFQSLFSFEVLGMDMRQAIGAILALCVILIIIKKVVL